MKNLWIILSLAGVSLFIASCDEDTFGANPYDPDTPVTVSEWPKVLSFVPERGKAGDIITITGENFATATKVTFGGRDAESFTIVDESTITAVLSAYGNSGNVAVTNHKGERSLPGFVYEWPVEPVENPNFALSGTATSTEPHSGFFTTSVNDGQANTAWVASNNNEGEERWVMIELDMLREINMVKLTWDPNAAGTDYVLEVSENGEDFTTVYQETGWVSNGDDAGVKTIKFDAVNAKYVRLGNLFNSLTPYNMTLWEFEIYNMPPAENLAEKKPADADCEANPDSKFHITDGKLANMWQTANDHDSHWATVDLGDAVDLDNIIISWDGGAYPKNLKISLSEDGAEYAEVYSVSDWNPEPEPREPGETVWTKVVTNAEFKEQKARYIRVDFDTPSSVWGITIYELEAYNQW